MIAWPGSVSIMVVPSLSLMVTSVSHMRSPRSLTHGSMAAIVVSSWTAIRPVLGS